MKKIQQLPVDSPKLADSFGEPVSAVVVEEPVTWSVAAKLLNKKLTTVYGYRDYIPAPGGVLPPKSFERLKEMIAFCSICPGSKAFSKARYIELSISGKLDDVLKQFNIR